MFRGVWGLRLVLLLRVCWMPFGGRGGGVKNLSFSHNHG